MEEISETPESISVAATISETKKFSKQISKIQDQAAAIEVGITDLGSKIPYVIQNYTYHNEDASTLIDKKCKQSEKISNFLEDMLQEQLDYFALNAECEADSKEIDEELIRVADILDLNHIIKKYNSQ